MKCPNCEAVVGSKAGSVCKNCGFSASLVPAVQTVEVQPVPEKGLIVRPVSDLKVRVERAKQPGSAKIVIDIDGTDSSREFQGAIQDLAKATLDCLSASIAKLDIDVWKHGDEDHDDAREQPVQLVQSGTIDQALDAVRGIQYRGGYDLLEAHATQYERLLDVTAWEPCLVGCRNILVGILTDETKLPRSGKTMSALGAKFKERGVKLVLVCQPKDNLRELVIAAGGFLIEISKTPSEGEIKQVVGMLFATLPVPVMGSELTIPLDVMVK
jgi:hypothetical protein